MKKCMLFFTVMLIGLIIKPLLAQDYQARMTNFVQVSEMKFQYDIQIRNIRANPDGAGAWAYNSSQFQIDINTAMLNSGQLDNLYFELDNTSSGLPSNQQLSMAANDFFYSGPNTALATSSPSTGNNSPLMLLNHGDWRTISRFIVKLRNAANTGFLNWADVDPTFIWRFGDTKVFSVPYYIDGNNIPRRSVGVSSVELSKTSTDLIIVSPERKLAGYWFYKTNTYQTASHWNQLLKAATPTYTQVVPGASNNAVIVGAATVTDGRSINELTVAQVGYLVLNQDAQLTTNKLYNDNQNSEKRGETVIASWDFENAYVGTTTPYPYLSDAGISANINSATFQVITPANIGTYFNYSTSGGTIGPRANSWFDDMGEVWGYWKVKISTLGFENLNLWSKQWSQSSAPSTFQIQWSLNGTEWTSVGSSISVASNWTTGVVTKLNFPADISNQPTIYIRWIATGGSYTGYSGIDDIIITGDPLPSGILLESTAVGTGSLLHNTDGVVATIKCYIPANHIEALHHLVSVPIAQSANPLSGLFLWSFLYLFDPEAQGWVNLGASTTTPLDVSRGYMIMKYASPIDWNIDTTYSFTGPMNNGSFTMNVFDQNGDPNGHLNLVPNPFPSAIDWDAVNGWTKTEINASIWIWNPVKDTYAAYVTGQGGINDCSNFIPVGQSFFIKSTAHSPVLTVNNDARVHNDQFFFKDKKEVSNVLRIKAIANDYSDETLISFKAEATTGYDGQFDAGKLFSDKKAPQIYTVATDQEELCINALPYSPEVIVIPMGFKLKESGLCTFSATSIESFDPSVTIFLEDCIAGTMTDLRKQPEYSFMHTAGNDPLRFKLIFNGTTSIEESEASYVQLYFNEKTLYLNFSEDKAETVHICIYSTNGQLVFDTYGQTVNSEIHVPNLTRGVYVVRLITDSKSIIKKVMSN